MSENTLYATTEQVKVEKQHLIVHVKHLAVMSF